MALARIDISAHVFNSEDLYVTLAKRTGNSAVLFLQFTPPAIEEQEAFFEMTERMAKLIPDVIHAHSSKAVSLLSWSYRRRLADYRAAFSMLLLGPASPVYSSSVRASRLSTSASPLSTHRIIGRQQTLQSSVYSWESTEQSMSTSICSPQYGHWRLCACRPWVDAIISSLSLAAVFPGQGPRGKKVKGIRLTHRFSNSLRVYPYCQGLNASTSPGRLSILLTSSRCSSSATIISLAYSSSNTDTPPSTSLSNL